MRVSRKGLRFLTRWEGFSAEPYNDAAGHCTRGYGELIHYGRCTGKEAATSKLRARQLLRRELDSTYIEPLRDSGIDFRQCEVDALVSLIYNVGQGVVADPDYSTLAKRLLSHEARLYPRRCRIYRDEFHKWDVAGGQHLEGLAKRRAAELRLANHADYSGRP